MNGGVVWPFIIKGCHNVITNNIAVDNQAHASVYFIRLSEWGYTPIYQQYYARNIFYQQGGNLVYDYYAYEHEPIEMSDYNVFYYPGGVYNSNVSGTTVTWSQWQSRYGARFDHNTTLGDPLFVDRVGRDYRVRPGSPALAKGFENIDVSKNGLRPWFPYMSEVKKANAKFTPLARGSAAEP